MYIFRFNKVSQRLQQAQTLHKRLLVT